MIIINKCLIKINSSLNGIGGKRLAREPMPMTDSEVIWNTESAFCRLIIN
jgi:hypothetical protein